MSDTNTSGDSSELEALFDSIASGATPSVAAPTPAPTPAPAPAPKPSLMQQARENDGSAEDSQDLQELFDSIARKQRGEPAASDLAVTAEGSDAWPAQGKVFKQVGLMARQLHDTLGALGYDKLIEKTVSAIPDARDRLAYIANLTEQAACKVLNATDIANPLQEELEEGAVLLANKWDALYANKLTVEEFKLLASETRAYLKNAVPQRTSATKEQLMEIMMAQDFQDLTGQVIKKVVGLAQDLESQLMGLLIETMPGEKRTESVQTLLNGPVINAEGRTDVVVSQQQVDELLDSLGF
ncbi:MAG: protein phosphatase CheZ [Propionivibrio sp.]|jgi:chemotaxis protein CheZ|uniref:protein phosphatase CheZ n=1 Tax=Propionivibrio sp. TaxID=2212460 RepID=UPI001B744A0A|nr:protein phosphatase CheZ [Propionivibrio sp.]MBP7202102.1 protein phosphatase CheZ [Propionivibrio sp.]